MKASDLLATATSPIMKLKIHVIACLFLLSACEPMSAEGTPTGDNTKPAKMAAKTNMASEKPRSAEKVFEDACMFCHGHYIAPGLSVAPVIRGRELPAEITKTFVRNGLGVMPAFRVTEISDEELESLANWITASEAPPMPAPPQMPPQTAPGATQ